MKIIKTLLLVIITFTAVCNLNAQVTIGSDTPPEKAALLDIKTKESNSSGGISSENGGLLLPRVEIDDVNDFTLFFDKNDPNINYTDEKRKHIGLTVYNIREDHQNNLEKGIYVWDGERWLKSAYRNRVNFFYMPTMMLDTSPGQHTKDLYGEYIRQFTNPKAASPLAPGDVPFFAKPTDLYYYVTDFDTDVFEENPPNNMTITADGILTYTVKASPVDGKSYINIVFVIK